MKSDLIMSSNFPRGNYEFIAAGLIYLDVVGKDSLIEV